jgi:osmotically-inducible protein OsmY
VPGVESGQDAVRTRAAIEQRLRNRGLLRESSSDRWGVTVEVTGNGMVTVAGTLRDTALQNEAVRIIRETPGVRDVRENITIPKRAEN